MERLIILLVLSCSPLLICGQTKTILVSEQTIKVGNNEELYFGFKKGDEIIFDLDVVKGKNIKEVEILEYPNASKFHDFKSKRISNKSIKVNKDAVYKFRIKGGGLGSKICKIKIYRNPASIESELFDTSVNWKTRYDSTYTSKTIKELVEIDTTAISIEDRVERVHSQTNIENSNTSRFDVSLPLNQTEKYQTTELISWAYWIGVGVEGQENYESEKKKYLLENTNIVSSMVDPLAGLALGAFAMLSNPPAGDNIIYRFITQYNGEQIVLAEGNSVVSNGRITKMKQGAFTVHLKNDNIMDGLNIAFKISAIVVTKRYEERLLQVLEVKETEYPVLSSKE